jgi:hypothetical protein
VFTLPSGNPTGNVPALGRLTISDASGIGQDWVVGGIETDDKYDVTAASAPLFFEAESRTLLSSSTVVTLSGSSGGGTNNAVESIALLSADIPIWSTQASGGGAHLSHVGQFRVFARVQNHSPNNGVVTFRLDWASGDFSKYNSNDSRALGLSASDTFQLVDLGLVNIPEVASGAQRWEGRVIANGTSAVDKLRLDCFFLVPVDTAAWEIAASAQVPAAAPLGAYDGFAQTAGGLSGKTLPVGGTWSGAGDADDFQVSGAGVVTRNVINDTGAGPVGRVALAGSATYTNVLASVNWAIGSGSTVADTANHSGLMLRYVDANNYVFAGATNTLTTSRRYVSVLVRAGGTDTVFLAGNGASGFSDPAFTGGGAAATIQAAATADGSFNVWINGVLKLSGAHAALATGGAVASGQVGLYDQVANVVSPIRTFDEFKVMVPAFDAAIYANQSLEVRWDSVIREDAAGVIWQRHPFEGDLLTIPPAGRRGRRVRVIVKASRNVPGNGTDAGIDDISAVLAYYPRFLSVPAPT